MSLQDSMIVTFSLASIYLLTYCISNLDRILSDNVTYADQETQTETESSSDYSSISESDEEPDKFKKLFN